ncbi:hypothetical protein GOV05_05100 [Candidatus Woesearchaeota archaeon]|nr:hypothetical protein [Candidatus Woesearchaeota archaeon]
MEHVGPLVREGLNITSFSEDSLETILSNPPNEFSAVYMFGNKKEIAEYVGQSERKLKAINTAGITQSGIAIGLVVTAYLTSMISLLATGVVLGLGPSIRYRNFKKSERDGSQIKIDSKYDFTYSVSPFAEPGVFGSIRQKHNNFFDKDNDKDPDAFA